MRVRVSGPAAACLRRVLMFMLAGGLAFGVDMGVLAALVHGLGAAPTIARIVSILAATSAAWYVNRRLAFAARRSGRFGREWLCYLVVNGLGMALNYVLYVALVSWTAIGAAYPLAGVIPGGVVALAVNYGLAARWVFPSRAVSSVR